MRLAVKDVLEATGGSLAQGSASAPLSGVSTDSRTVGAGELFVAIRGERFDGHRYVADALAAGAGAALVSQWPLGAGTDRPVIVVPDTKQAYGALGAWWRQRMPARVVGVTGSNGKTTTKEMIAHLLSRLGPTLRSEANHNNHIGVPQTLLRLRPHHAFAVVEMGTNHPLELARLAQLVRPELGVITNIGPTHLEAFRTVRGVAREKGRLLDFIRPRGLAVLHADDPWSRRLAARHAGRVTTFGLGPAARWRAAAVWPNGSRLRFVLAGLGESFSVPVVGRCQVSNCLAAIAVAAELGLSVGEAAWQFRSFRPPEWRMALRRVGGLTLICDCYNANPASMDAAMEELARRPVAGRRVAVVGDMLELGRASTVAHRRLGHRVALAGVDLLCAVGPAAARTAEAAVRSGMPRDRVFATTHNRAAGQWLAEHLEPDDTVLLKASRGVRLEEVVHSIEQWAGEAEAVVTS
ncbi:MAG: UDP-N-acetylmuramoyl-tripeptide--D-alanyl-D-alanine ligase [Candidatus Brocadiia bacterium]